MFFAIIISPLLEIARIQFSSKFSSPIVKKFLSEFNIFIIVFIFLAIYRATWGFWHSAGPYLLGFGIIWLCYEYTAPLWLYPKKKTYSEKLEAVEKQRKSYQPKFYFDYNNYKDRIIILWILLFFLYAFAGDLGTSEAIRKKNFLVLSDEKNSVVLRIYDDKYVCAPFHRETKQVDRSFIILESSGQNELRFNLEKVGPLKLVDIKTNDSANSSN